MNELRKMIKAVNKYVVLIYNNPEKVRKNCNIYLNDVELLQNMIDSYIDEMCELFQNSCNISVTVWSSSSNNIFCRIKRFISIEVINHHLNKYSYNLAAAGILKRNLEIINTRLIQIQQLT